MLPAILDQPKLDSAKLSNVISDFNNEEDASSMSSSFPTLIANINSSRSVEIISSVGKANFNLIFSYLCNGNNE